MKFTPNRSTGKNIRRYPSSTFYPLFLCLWILSLCFYGLMPLKAKEPSLKTPLKPAPPLRTMIGQMFVVGFHGQSPQDKSVQMVRHLLDKGKIGGVILMGHNIKSPKQIKKLTDYLKASTAPLPPFISIDQEGGLVQRLKSDKGFINTPPAGLIAKTKTPDEAYHIYKDMARALKQAGINLNFGPVVDLALQEKNPIISTKGRSYGKAADKVALFGKHFILAHRHYNILTSLKHFPGHGSGTVDSHDNFVDLTKSWSETELSPFEQLNKEGLADTIMIGHLYHLSFSDGDKKPASLSAKAITKTLRSKLKFNGLVITDDLEMGAINKHFKDIERLQLAINAGNDILLLSHPRRAAMVLINETINKLASQVNDNQIDRLKITNAYQRIKRVKKTWARDEQSRTQLLNYITSTPLYAPERKDTNKTAPPTPPKKLKNNQLHKK